MTGAGSSDSRLLSLYADGINAVFLSLFGLRYAYVVNR